MVGDVDDDVRDETRGCRVIRVCRGAVMDVWDGCGIQLTTTQQTC